MKNVSIKKIIIVTNHHDQTGGVLTFTKTIASGFKSRGYNVTVLTISRKHKTPHPSDFETGIKHAMALDGHIPAPRRSKNLLQKFNPLRLLYNWRIGQLKNEAYRNLRKIFTTWGRDTAVIITQLYGAEYLKNAGMSFTNKEGPYVIGQYHSSFEAARDSGDLKRIKRCFSDADKFIVLMDEYAKDFQRSGLNNTGFIHNPVRNFPLSDFRNKKKQIISLGRYSEEKSLEYAIEAWSKVKDKKDWQLLLYGEGPEKAKLEERITRHGLGDSVILAGKTNDVETVLDDASIHVMSSQFEGTPLSIVEAARCSVPTVSFDSSGGIRWLVRDGETGLITPLNDTVALAHSLERLMHDERLRQRMGKRAREKSEIFMIDRVMDEWQEELKQLIL